MRAPEPTTLTPLKDGLAAIVREAGALAASTFRGENLKSWTKAGDSPVSEADIAVDRFLRERLTRLAPDCGWLSEETEDDRARLGGARLWIVDPIDGTRAYVAGRIDWSVSVALVENGRPIAARGVRTRGGWALSGDRGRRRDARRRADPRERGRRTSRARMSPAPSR